MFDNILEQQRIQKANELKNAGVNPYPHFLVKELSLADFKKKFSYIFDTENKRDESISSVISGRLKLLRIAGKSIFANIEDENENLQIYFSKDSLGEEKFNLFKKILKWVISSLQKASLLLLKRESLACTQVRSL